MMQKRGASQFPLPHIDPGVPPEFGTTPIPEGTVRFNHYTNSAAALPSIRAGGLRESYARESFARGGTESPETFATAGAPSIDFRHSAHYVEGYADPQTQLNIGERRDPADLEARRSTITMRGDIPAHQIIASHEPWHETARYLQNEPQMERGIMAGDYDTVPEPNLERALNTSKMALAAKVMTGGKLGGKSYEDEGIPTERNPNPKKQ